MFPERDQVEKENLQASDERLEREDDEPLTVSDKHLGYIDDLLKDLEYRVIDKSSRHTTYKYEHDDWEIKVEFINRTADHL